MADGEKKRKEGNAEILISRKWKELFDGMKNIFHRAIIWLKIKTCLKIADQALS